MYCLDEDKTCTLPYGVLSLYWTLKDIGFFDKVEMDEKEKLLEIQQHKKGRKEDDSFIIEEKD